MFYFYFDFARREKFLKSIGEKFSSKFENQNGGQRTSHNISHALQRELSHSKTNEII